MPAESKAMSLTIYHTAIICAVVLGVWLGLRDSISEIAISFMLGFGIMIGATLFASALFVPIVVKMVNAASSVSDSAAAAVAVAANEDENEYDSGLNRLLAVHGPAIEGAMQRIAAQGKLSSIERRILAAFHEMKKQQKQTQHHYRLYRKAMMSISQLNAELHYMKASDVGRVQLELTFDQDLSNDNALYPCPKC